MRDIYAISRNIVNDERADSKSIRSAISLSPTLNGPATGVYDFNFDPVMQEPREYINRAGNC